MHCVKVVFGCEVWGILGIDSELQVSHTDGAIGGKFPYSESRDWSVFMLIIEVADITKFGF